MDIRKSINTVGVLGGGQLGMFLCKASKKLNLKTIILSENKDCSASKFCDELVLGKFEDLDVIKKFIQKVDVVTIETENIPLKTLKFIEEKKNLKPSSKIIEIAQNRIKEKKFLNSLEEISTTEFMEINYYKDLLRAFDKFGKEFLIKSSEFGYDGKNQFKINEKNIKKFKNFSLNGFVAEKIVDFEKEISVISFRDEKGNIEYLPPVHNLHQNNILKSTTFPPDISKETKFKAINYAKKITFELNLIGVLAVEMFVQKNGEILINELAPRPHNSGHWSLDCCETNQFENLLRAISEQKVLAPRILSGGIMKNLIGRDYLKKINKKKNIKVYDYYKNIIKKNRKMGHVTHIKKL